MAREKKMTQDELEREAMEMSEAEAGELDTSFDNFLQASDEATKSWSPTDGGTTLKKIKLKENQSITGQFIGYAPFEYEDEDTAKRDDSRDGKVVLSDVLIDVINPRTGQKIGVIAKVTGTNRILSDLVLASPGDKVCIARFGSIELGKKRMWDDRVRIFPSEPGRKTVTVSAKPIASHKELDAFRAQSEKLLPGSSAASSVQTREEIEAREAAAN